MRCPHWLMTSLTVALLHTGVAEARFGKSGSGGSSGRSSSSSSSSSSSTHAAVPANSGSSSGSSSSSSSNARSRSNWGTRSGYGYGYFGGAFVPWYGYGPRVLLATPAPVVESESTVRVTAAVDLMVFVANQQRGFTLGLSAGFEGERFGFNLTGQNISVKADDGSGTTDNLQQLSAHLSFAFLTGQYGRLRAEAGADVVFAPSAVLLAPTLGVSGTLWIVGPLAFESSVYASVYPFWQLDWRAGLVIGAGPIGFRLGWRTQVLDDRGVVDGIVHRDVFMGPTAGMGFAF